MKATILINGIALFYHKGDGLWKVLFPFDKCHTVKLLTPDNGTGVSLGTGEGSQVRIKATGAASKFDIDPNFADFLDLTSDNAHSSGVKLKDDANPFVLLTIESAKVSVGTHTLCRFQLFDANENVGLTPFRRIAYSGKAEIDSEKIEIEINGNVEHSFEHDNIVIAFDNLCPTEDPKNPVSDLILLYDVIEDASGSGKEFTVDRHPDEKPGAALVTGPILGLLGPVDNNPAVFLPGLPCNVFKAGKSNLLE